jgi:hypothetical protein
LAGSQANERRPTIPPHFVHRLLELTSRKQQTQRTLLDWLRMEYAIKRPSKELLAATDLDSDTWVGEVKRIRGKKHPLTAPGLRALRDEYTRTIARALAAETLTLERTVSDLVNQAYALTPAETALMWQTAPPRMPIPPALKLILPVWQLTRRSPDCTLGVGIVIYAPSSAAEPT